MVLASTSGAKTREQDILRHKQRPSRKGGFKTTFCERIKKQKNRTIRKHSISKTEGPQEKQQRVELSSISNFQAVSELLTFEGLSAIPSSRLQSSQKPLEAPLDLKMSPSSPTSPCHNLPVSLSSDSSVHLNSNAHSILFSGAQVPHVPSATGFSNVGIPFMPSETVFSSSSAPQISQITVPSSIRDLYLPKPAAFNSTEAPHKQAIASRNGQTTREPSAKLTSKSQFLKLHPPATASSNSQVHHTLATMPRSISVTQVPQTRTSSSIQTLNSATVKASKNVQAPQVSLPIRPNYFLASVAPPSATPNRLTSHGPLLSIATSRAQTTQIEPGTESICVQALHAPPSTVSRSKCTTPLTQGAESSTGKALPLPKVKACTIFQAPRVSSPTASSGIMKPHATSSKTSSSLLDQHATSSTASSSSLLALKLSPVTASRALSAIPGLSETIHRSPSRAPRRGTVPKEPSREEGHHQGPKQVMVLKVTEPFTYDFEETKRMFHATVATETEFFRVKVFDTALMSKFIPGKIIAISHYIGCNGFLEIYRASCVSDVNINPTMIISNTLSESAIATPKISYLLSQAKGTFVNGEFVVFKKSERHECICYGIGDDTGKMAVVVYGRLTNVRCEPGSKLRLVCFELTSTKDVCLLRSVRHSYMQVINEGKPLNPDSVRRNSLEPYF